MMPTYNNEMVRQPGQDKMIRKPDENKKMNIVTEHNSVPGVGGIMTTEHNSVPGVGSTVTPLRTKGEGDF
jgi:hypothetical protein